MWHCYSIASYKEAHWVAQNLWFKKLLSFSAAEGFYGLSLQGFVKLEEKKRRLTLQILKLRLLSQLNTDSGAVRRPTLSADMHWNSNTMAFNLAEEGDMAEERDHLMPKPAELPGKAL